VRALGRGTPVITVGPGARLATGIPEGSASTSEFPISSAPSLPEALSGDADLTIVDTTEGTRTDAERVSALDAALRTVQEQAAPGTRIIVASLADDEEPGPQMAVLPAGSSSAHGTSGGLVVGTSTHRPGLAQLTDLAPTLTTALIGRSDRSFDGQALKRRFLRSPLEYTRISSGFSLGRRHPVFRDWRVHKGIDYAAPTGTKIRSVGDGTIEFLGTQRGYGNVIIVKHDDVQRTLYAHMSRFSPKLRLGDKIKQGQVIGEVGQTGWATGPHLHFEFQVNGQQIDPNPMLPQPAPALDTASRNQLRAQAEQVIDLMRWQESTTVASFE